MFPVRYLEEKYGKQLLINYNSKKLKNFLDNCRIYYSDDILKRVEYIVNYQLETKKEYLTN